MIVRMLKRETQNNPKSQPPKSPNEPNVRAGLGIHPNRVGDIVRILRRLVERHPETQIVMTGHSPYLVDAFQPNEVTWCRRDAISVNAASWIL